MSDYMSKEKFSKLLKKLKNDLPLAKSLGLSEEVGNFSDNESNVRKSKRNISHLSSPIKTKKFKKTPASAGIVNSLENLTSVSNLPPAGSLNLIAQDAGTSNACASVDNADDVNSDISSEEGDPLDKMEAIINDEGNDEPDSEHESEGESDGFEILGAPAEASWVPPKKSLDFYLKVADLDLSKDITKDIESHFKADEETEKHFHPPKFPAPFWNAVQNSPADSFKLKAIHKVQENLYLSIKPLLNSLGNCPKSVQNDMTQAIQLICSSNLHLNRLRRATIAPHLKPDIKKNLMSLPVKHDSFFGEDFNKTTDSLLKEQAAIEKVLATKPKPQKSSYKNYKSSSYSSTSGGFGTNQRFFRGYASTRGRGNRPFARGGFRGRRGSYHKRGFNKSNPNYDSVQPGPSGNPNFQ